MSRQSKKLEQAHEKARKKRGATGSRRGTHKVAFANDPLDVLDTIELGWAD